MRRIALFGGSFNPFHIMHQIAVFFVLETGDVDEVWVVPCFKHNFGKGLAPFHHRLKMCQLGTSSFGSRVVVSDIEEKLGDVSRTYDTVKAIQQQCRPELPNTDGVAISLVVGADVVPEIPSWHKGQELLDSVPLIKLSRGGYPLSEGGIVLPEMSSTLIRSHIAKGWTIRNMVSSSVEAYIRQHKLYQQQAA